MTDPHEALHEALAGKYELEKVLGEGGMGTVYLARDRKHDRQVAIKTIHPELTTTEVRNRFEREIQITAHLQHPHILPLLDSGVAGETRSRPRRVVGRLCGLWGVSLQSVARFS